MDENAEIELSPQQHHQLQEFKESVNNKYLQETCEQIQSDLEHLRNEKKQHLHMMEQLKTRYDVTQQDILEANEERNSLHDKLESTRNLEKYDDIISLEYICLLLGFQLSKCHLITLCKTDKELHENWLGVTHNDFQNMFDHLETYPSSPAIDKIREFVKNSQDLEGVLKSLKQLVNAEVMEEFPAKKCANK